MSPASPTSSPEVDSPRWNPQVIGLVGLICSIFLLFSYYKILERNCLIFRISRNSSQRRRLNQHLEEFSSQLHSRGLESSVMHALPITQFKRPKDDQETRTECAVCLGEFEEEEWVKHLPICSHVFHVSCIDTWFQTHSSCPLCRSYVCDARVSSVDVDLVLQTLSREDFNRERLERFGGVHVPQNSLSQSVVQVRVESR